MCSTRAPLIADRNKTHAQKWEYSEKSAAWQHDGVRPSTIRSVARRYVPPLLHIYIILGCAARKIHAAAAQPVHGTLSLVIPVSLRQLLRYGKLDRALGGAPVPVACRGKA